MQSQAAQLEVRHTWGNPAPTLPVMGLIHSLGHVGAVDGRWGCPTGMAAQRCCISRIAAAWDWGDAETLLPPSCC